MIPLKDDNPSRTVPFVTMGLVAANVVVFVYTAFLGQYGTEAVVRKYAAVPAAMFGADGLASVPAGAATVISSMFLHGSLLHVGMNMLYLWIFGDNVEDAFGHVRYLLFYLACGLAGGVAQGLTDPSSTVPMIGASGAVSGVLGAYMLLYPKARVWTFFFFLFFWQVVRVPALVLIGLWVLLQLVSGVAEFGSREGGVAWFAHLGGFAVGALAAAFSGRKKRRAYR